jgi:uncharacterized protein YndB with AHSA1/START domain
MTDSDKEGAGIGSTDAEQELVITRVFAAPRDLVYHALTELDGLRHWWGPRDCTWVSGTVDLRPGGTFHYCMRAPDGRDMWGKWVYREIVPPERLVFVSSFADEHGNTVRAPLSAHWPLEIVNTLTLTEHEGQTVLTLRGGPLNATEEERATFDGSRQSVRQGFAGTWERLDDYLRVRLDNRGGQ